MTPPSRTGPSAPWDLLGGLICWSAWPFFALGWSAVAFVPLGITLVVVPMACALGIAHRERYQVPRSERTYARLAGSIATLPFGITLGATLAALAGGGLPLLFATVGLSIAFGAITGPNLADRLSGEAWWVLPALPIATASLVYLSACLAMAHVGNWPQSGNPDPVSLHDQIIFFATLDVLATMGVIATPLAPSILLLLVPLWFRVNERGASALRASRCFALAFIGWIALIALDPGGAVDWLLD